MHWNVTPEGVAYWFFRLNGCLTIVNFVVHPDLTRKDEPRGQRTDVDILAVRFPYRRELLTSGRPMEDHPVFNKDRINLIIAEVKSSGYCRLNGPWTRKPDRNMHRVLYAIGAFPSERVPEIAEALYSHGAYCDERFDVRLFAIAAKPADHPPLPEVKQLTWKEILGFIWHRFDDYCKHKAQHEQWDPLGQNLYAAALGLSREEFIERMLKEMQEPTPRSGRLF